MCVCVCDSLIGKRDREEKENRDGGKAEMLREMKEESERKGVHSLLITHSSSLVSPDLNPDITM